MDYKKAYEVGKVAWVEAQIDLYELETGIILDAHNKSVLRQMKRCEFDRLEREAIREDSHGPVGDRFNQIIAE